MQAWSVRSYVDEICKRGAYVERGSGGFATRKKFESMPYRSWENAIKMARLETYTHTRYNCQAHRPYRCAVLTPRNFDAGIRRIRKVVLENIGGATAPPCPPFPALLILSMLHFPFARCYILPFLIHLFVGFFLQVYQEWFL